MTDNPSTGDTLYCAAHPDRPTQLRCNRCEKPICPKCMVRTPTGYRCRECVYGQQKIFDTAQVSDYFIALIAAALLSVIGSVLIFFFSLGLFTIFISPFVGSVASNIVRRLTGKRRSKKMFLSAAAGFAAGILPVLLFSVIGVFIGEVAWTISVLVWQLVYAGLGASTTYYQLSGITIRR